MARLAPTSAWIAVFRSQGRALLYRLDRLSPDCGTLADAGGPPTMAVVGLGGPDDEPASISCQFISSAFSARVTRSRAPRRASNCSSRNVRVAPVPFYSACRYLCAIVEAVAWLDAGPTDACGVPTSGLPVSFSGRVFIPAPSAPRQVHPSTLHESEVYVSCRGARPRASASGLSPKLRLHPPEQKLEGCRTPCGRRLYRTLWSPTLLRWAHAERAFSITQHVRITRCLTHA
jgi:hypothetical protein